MATSQGALQCDMCGVLSGDAWECSALRDPGILADPYVCGKCKRRIEDYRFNLRLVLESAQNSKQEVSSGN